MERELLFLLVMDNKPHGSVPVWSNSGAAAFLEVQEESYPGVKFTCCETARRGEDILKPIGGGRQSKG